MIVIALPKSLGRSILPVTIRRVEHVFYVEKQTNNIISHTYGSRRRFLAGLFFQSSHDLAFARSFLHAVNAFDSLTAHSRSTFIANIVRAIDRRRGDHESYDESITDRSLPYVYFLNYCTRYAAGSNVDRPSVVRPFRMIRRARLNILIENRIVLGNKFLINVVIVKYALTGRGVRNNFQTRKR